MGAQADFFALASATHAGAVHLRDPGEPLQGVCGTALPEPPALWDAAERAAQDAATAAGVKLDWARQVLGLQALPACTTLVAARLVGALLATCMRDAATSRILVRIRADHNALSVLVRDNGSGLPPFDTTGARSLAVLYTTARQHGGHLAQHSQLGEGSAFHLRMPLGAGGTGP